ncbi:hypothetical protein BJX99DRAFT_230032 [Aspergillus californicus]
MSRKCHRLASFDSMPTMQNRSASMPVRDDAYHPSNATHSVRDISKPQHQHVPRTEELEHVYLSNEHKQETPREIKTSRVRRLTSHLNSRGSVPRSQTTPSLNCQATFTRSRLPTPTGTPQGDMYSHSMYQREVGRTVPSYLERRNSMRGRETSNIQRIIMNQTNGPSPQGHVISQDRKRLLAVLTRSPIQYREADDRSEFIYAVKNVLSPTPRLVQRRIEKERHRDNSSSGSQSQLQLPHYHQYHSRFSFSDSSTAESSMTTMDSPRRLNLSLTRGFENLRKTKIPMPLSLHKRKTSPCSGKLEDQKTQPQTQTDEQVKENTPTTYVNHDYQPRKLSPSNTYSHLNEDIPKLEKLPSRIPLASPGSIRRQAQTEKMVPAPLQSKNKFPHLAPSSQLLNGYSIQDDPVLTRYLQSRPQVETAMPQAYWLGRLSNLKDVFHYEDSFGVPDDLTGFKMSSSYSRPFQGSNESNMDGFRVKRAFMALENLCATAEASASLLEFRDAYIRCKGDRWMA